MSTLTEQIKAKCTIIAENQKKIYDLGFAKGKASVKHIIFYINGDGPLCALSGMTWREYIESDINFGFYVNDGSIFYQSRMLYGIGLDDEIVGKGYYETIGMFRVLYNSQSYELPCYGGEMWERWVESEFNTIGLYFDDNGYLRAPTGEYIFSNNGNSLKVDKAMYIELYNEYEAKTVYTCDIFFETALFDAGMTWEEYSNSAYNYGVYIDGNLVRHYAGDGAFYYNGVQVKPTDALIDGAKYQYQ